MSCNSVSGDLKSKLEEFVDNYFMKVKLLRTKRREGLIRCKVQGAKEASGDVLVFLDSHCEVNEDWLPPLLERIKDNRKTVPCPMIDIIRADTFEYCASPMVKGGFNWGLHFSWEPLSGEDLKKSEDFAKPFK